MPVEAPPSPTVAPAPSGVMPVQSTQPVHMDPKPVVERPPAKPGTARADLIDGLYKKAGVKPPDRPKQDEAPKPKETPKATAKENPKADPTDANPPEPGTSEPSADKPLEGQAEKPKEKVNPWKVLEDYKQRWQKSEAKIAELTKGTLSPEQQKAAQEQFQTMQTRLKELEGEIRYVNYTKSQEFQEKYQNLYEVAWQRAVSNLSEIPVTNADGSSRQLAAQDILALVNMPLAEAKAAATERFGEFADDVMAERKEIRRLWDTQNAALEDARKTADQREQQMKQAFQTNREQIKTEITGLWENTNQEILNDERFGVYFKPSDGDEEGNASLDKGFKLVDEAFAVNPLNPKLTPEQRAQAVKKHAIVRNRAAAFGRLTLQVKKANDRIASLEKQLAEYTTTTPDTAGRNGGTSAPAPKNTREEVFDAFRKKARAGF